MIKVAAVGCGAHATSTIWPLLTQSGFSLAAAWSRSQARVERAADKWGIPNAYTDYDRMLDAERPEAIVVVVPPAGFGPLIQKAIARGIHVFAEKPGAASPDEANEIADAAGRKGVVAMVGYMKRFGSEYARAKRIIDSPEFGPLTIASFKWAMGPMSDEHKTMESWLFENPTHHVDLARFLCGEIVAWRTLSATTTGPEFALAVSGRTAGGAVVSMQLSTTASWEHHNERVEVQGQGASVTVDNLDTCISRPVHAPELVWRPNYTLPEPRTSSATTMGFLPELEVFARAIREGATVDSDFRSAALTLEAVRSLADSIEA